MGCVLTMEWKFCPYKLLFLFIFVVLFIQLDMVLPLGRDDNVVPSFMHFAKVLSCYTSLVYSFLKCIPCVLGDEPSQGANPGHFLGL